MKRFLTVFLAVIVALGATFALTACGNEQGEGRTYTITYELNGGINDPANPVNYTENTETITLRPATKKPMGQGQIFITGNFQENLAAAISQSKPLGKITERNDFGILFLYLCSLEYILAI